MQETFAETAQLSFKRTYIFTFNLRLFQVDDSHRNTTSLCQPEKFECEVLVSSSCIFIQLMRQSTENHSRSSSGVIVSAVLVSSPVSLSFVLKHDEFTGRLCWYAFNTLKNKSCRDLSSHTRKYPPHQLHATTLKYGAATLTILIRGLAAAQSHSGVSLAVSSLCRAGACGAGDVSAALPWPCEDDKSLVSPAGWTNEEFGDAFCQTVLQTNPSLH